MLPRGRMVRMGPCGVASVRPRFANERCHAVRPLHASLSGSCCKVAPCGSAMVRCAATADPFDSGVRAAHRRPFSREGPPPHPRAMVWPFYRRGRLPRGGLGRSAPLSRPIFVRVAGVVAARILFAPLRISFRSANPGREAAWVLGARVPPRVSRRRDTVGCPAAHELAYRPCLGACLARNFWPRPLARSLRRHGIRIHRLRLDPLLHAPLSPQARDRQVAAQLPHAAPLRRSRDALRRKFASLGFRLQDVPTPSPQADHAPQAAQRAR